MTSPKGSTTILAIDIVRRLRDGAPCLDASHSFDINNVCPDRSAHGGCDCTIAADEIDKLRKALKQIERICWEEGDNGQPHKAKLLQCRELAHDALY